MTPAARRGARRAGDACTLKRAGDTCTLKRAGIAGALLLALGVPAAAQQQAPEGPAGSGAAVAVDPAELSALADRYHDGVGVVQNFTRAAALYARAAAAGDAHAQNRLGRYAHDGLAGPPSRAEALRWLGAAAAQGGDPQYLVDYALVLEEGGTEADHAEAAALYERAVAAGHVEAAVSLGLLYQNGTGVARDYDRARRLYEAAAAAGNGRGQNNLGLLYVRGDGVDQDYARAAQLFRQAAAQGYAAAITNLGVMYENGFGVPQDEAEAVRLYRLGGQGGAPGGTAAAALPPAVYDPRLAAPPAPMTAAALTALQAAAATGDPVAGFQLGWLLASDEGADPAAARRAAALFRDGAGKGHAAAMANLGLLYLQGRGVPQDYVLGQMWLLLAATAGLPEAGALAATARQRMTPGQITDAQAAAETRWDEMQAARRP